VKYRSALKASREALPIALAFAAGFGVIAWVWPGWFTYMLLGVSVLGLVGELVNIATISRRAKQDPSLLDRRVP
jgi:hypothetical protein